MINDPANEPLPEQDEAGVTGSNAGTRLGTGQAGTEAAAGTSAGPLMPRSYEAEDS